MNPTLRLINHRTLEPYTPEELERLREAQEAFDQLHELGLIEIVGSRRGWPVYQLTDAGRRELAALGFELEIQ